jgi:hypothetical protein
MISRFFRLLACTACVIAALGSSTLPSRSQPDPLAAAFTQRNAELGEIKQRLAASLEQLGLLEQDVSRLAAFLLSRGDLTSAQAVEADEQLYEASWPNNWARTVSICASASKPMAALSRPWSTRPTRSPASSRPCARRRAPAAIFMGVRMIPGIGSS